MVLVCVAAKIRNCLKIFYTTSNFPIQCVIFALCNNKNMRRYIKLIAVVVVMAINCSVALADEGDEIIGVYRVLSLESKEPSNVKIYKKGDTYEGRIIWLERPLDDDGNPRLDVLNPNPALRSVPGDQVVVVMGFKYDPEKKRWIGGKVYNPEMGKVYDAIAEFESPNELKMRGYIGTPALGESYIWTKIE